MATLPTVPSYAFQEVPTVAKMQQLAGSVAFLSQMPIVASAKLSADILLTGATPTAVTWTHIETDSDGMHAAGNPTRWTAQTQGYYRFHAALAFTIPSAQEYQAYFQVTTGSGNPAGAGRTLTFGYDASVSNATTSEVMSIGIRSMTPCLYVGDYVEVYVYAGAGCYLKSIYEFAANDNAGNADGASCLYASYLFEGP